MAKGDVQRVAFKRPPPNPERIAERVAEFQASAAGDLGCIEGADVHPKEVQPLNNGFFVLEAMRRQKSADGRGK